MPAARAVRSSPGAIRAGGAVVTTLNGSIEAFTRAHADELSDDDALTLYAAAGIVARVHARYIAPAPAPSSAPADPGAHPISERYAAAYNAAADRRAAYAAAAEAVRFPRPAGCVAPDCGCDVECRYIDGSDDRADWDQ